VPTGRPHARAIGDHGVGSWASARLAPPVHLGSPLSNEKTLHLSRAKWRHGRLRGLRRCVEASSRHCLSVSRLLRTRPPGSW